MLVLARGYLHNQSSLLYVNQYMATAYDSTISESEGVSSRFRCECVGPPEGFNVQINYRNSNQPATPKGD